MCEEEEEERGESEGKRKRGNGTGRLGRDGVESGDWSDEERK